MFFFDEIIELRHEHMCNQIMDLAMEQVLEESREIPQGSPGNSSVLPGR